MLFAKRNAVAAAVLFKALLVQAVPFPFLLEERTGGTGCNADNLLRLLRTPSNLPEALPFCSSYLSLQASTSTVSTVTPTITSYTTAVTVETTFFTERPVVSETLTQTETSVSFTTTVITVQPPQRLARRCTSTTSRATTTKSTTSFPEKVTGTYEPSRISSACACLTIPVAISSVTATADAVTETITVESTSSTSETITITSTLSVSVTETTTIVSTVTSTVVNAAEPTAWALKIVAPGTADDGAYVYNRNENPNNNGPGASQVFPITTDSTQATKFQFNADGTLQIVTSSTLFASSVVGQESSVWIHFNHPTVTYEALYSNKLASVNGCSSCIVVKWQKDPNTGAVTPSNVSKPVKICNYPNAAYGRGLYLGTPSTNTYLCVDVTIQLVPLS